jgi:hypothetical protein
MTCIKRIVALLAGTMLAIALTGATARAEPLSTLLEKGIYQEQTVGDIDAAMQIYRQILDDAQVNRPLAGQAQYRMGLCQQKKKQTEAATESFRKVVSHYPDQKDLVAQAQMKLEELGSPSAAASPPAMPGRPSIVRTNPPAYAANVDPSLDKITVTFSMPMIDGSWSWTGSGETYPKTTGRPFYDAEKTTCTLSVKLEPGKAYWIGINSRDYKNFRSATGVPAPWYAIVFATRSADGKPTAIPQEMLAKARQLNTAAFKAPPVIVGTAPGLFANNVDPGLARVSVTFDQSMMNGSWSWVQYNSELYPTEAGNPSYDGSGRTCSLPVKLEAGHVYMIGFNGPSYHFFQNPGHMPAQPYVLLFATRAADGKPTPIPNDLAAQVTRFNTQPGSPVPQHESSTQKEATDPPHVVRTEPATSSTDVAASVTRITVTFDRKMADGSWSWTGGGDTYPQTTGRPSYDAPRRACSLPVKLEPGKVYCLGINSPSFRNFRAEDGASARPYMIVFATRSADGQPTPIPQEMLDQARQINGVPVGTDAAAHQSANAGSKVSTTRPGQ